MAHGKWRMVHGAWSMEQVAAIQVDSLMLLLWSRFSKRFLIEGMRKRETAT